MNVFGGMPTKMGEEKLVEEINNYRRPQLEESQNYISKEETSSTRRGRR